MTYTKEQLDAMSATDLSRAVKSKFFGRPQLNFDIYDWSDIMPLAVEHGVTYIKGSRTAYSNINFDCSDVYYDEYCECDIPQRAIACCLLMMEL